MAPPRRPWFRFYVEALSDRKLRRLTPAQRWLWVAILGAARQSPKPGVLLVGDEPMDAADLADVAAMPERDVAKALPLMERAGMLARDGEAWVVVNWSERQYESDDTTKRTQKHRSQEQRRNVPPTPDGTPPENREQKQIQKEPLAPTSSPPKPEHPSMLDDRPPPPVVPIDRPRKRDELFDAVAEACAINPAELTSASRGAINRAVAELRGLNVDPPEVAVRAGRFRRRYEGLTLTPSALAKHWPQLATDDAPKGRGRQSLEERARALAGPPPKDAS